MAFHPQHKYVFLGVASIAFLAILAIGFVIISRNNVPTAELANVTDFSGQYDVNAQTAIFEGQQINPPLFARSVDDYVQSRVLGFTSSSDKWIEVDLSEQKVKAWNGSTLFLESAISTGLPGTPTPTGEFSIWYKLRYTKMEGGRGKNYYNLPNVPFTMFFHNDAVPGWKGYGLHGTYWHNSFGTPRSHGCVNLPTPIAEQIYNWSEPVIPAGAGSVQASAGNPGTRIVIHE